MLLKENNRKKDITNIKGLLLGCIATITLFLFQEIVGKAGSAIAGQFSYDRIDPNNVYGWQSVHHLVMLLITLAVVALLSRWLKIDFGFKIGNKETGMRYFLIFSAAFVIIALIYHALMVIGNRLPTYDFPLNYRNVIGTLGFQLLLSGTTEEILFRALPVTVLIYAFGKSVVVNGDITLEIILASLLFAAAHIKWSLFPLDITVNNFQLIYAFSLGIIEGIAFQKSQSVLYPILMHSTSNVLMVGTGYLFTVLV